MRNRLIIVAALLLMDHPALAQTSQRLVPCASISPHAVTSVPAPFNTFMKLACYNGDGQGLFPPDGTHWLAGHNEVALSAMDDRLDPNGQPRLSTSWYVSLTPRSISPAADAQLRAVLTQAVRPEFINGATIAELEADTSSGELKQEFIISPADPTATHGIKLLLECHHFCQGSDKPWILGIVPDSETR